MQVLYVLHSTCTYTQQKYGPDLRLSKAETLHDGVAAISSRLPSVTPLFLHSTSEDECKQQQAAASRTPVLVAVLQGRGEQAHQGKALSAERGETVET